MYCLLKDSPDLVTCLALLLGNEEEGALPCALHASACVLYVAGAAGCAFPAYLMVNVRQFKNFFSS